MGEIGTWLLLIYGFSNTKWLCIEGQIVVDLSLHTNTDIDSGTFMGATRFIWIYLE